MEFPDGIWRIFVCHNCNSVNKRMLFKPEEAKEELLHCEFCGEPNKLEGKEVLEWK